jgi:hypothetical protein
MKIYFLRFFSRKTDGKIFIINYIYLYQIFDVDLDPKISTLEIKYKKSGLFSIYFSDWHDLVTN